MSCSPSIRTFDLSSITDFDDNDPDPCLGLQRREADDLVSFLIPVFPFECI